MDPILVTVGGYPVYRYSVLLDAGVAAGVGLAAWLARRQGLPLVAFLDATLWALAAAFVGARAHYVLAHWDEYVPRPLNAVNVWEGGLALPGAVTAGALAAWPAARLAGLRPGRALDAAAPAVALGQAVGRLGCLTAGCAFGASVEEGAAVLALALPDASGVVAHRFPSQPVEAAGEVLLSAALLALWARRPRPGTVAAAYLAGYGLLRAALEPFRGDSTYLAGLPLAQVWALLALALGVAFLAGLHFRGRAAASPRRSTIGAPE